MHLINTCLKEQLLSHKFDIAEAIVAVSEIDFEGTLIEFIEANKDAYDALDVLQIVTALFATGVARIDVGNGAYIELKLVWVDKVSDRGVELPYLAA